MRRFELHRDTDATGVSGTGVVAQGCEFDNGMCVLTWLSKYSSTAVYASIRLVEQIHGHQGQTRLVWLDHDPQEAYRLKLTEDPRPRQAEDPAGTLGRKLHVEYDPEPISTRIVQPGDIDNCLSTPPGTLVHYYRQEQIDA